MWDIIIVSAKIARRVYILLEYVIYFFFVEGRSHVSSPRLNLKLLKCVNALNVLIYNMKLVHNK
jgi:hypothetical protein